jgi:predicted RNase H-like HicB family nuclease
LKRYIRTLAVSTKLEAVIHDAEEGGYWAEVPALPGCYTQAETLAELRRNVRIAVDLYLDESPVSGGDRRAATRPAPESLEQLRGSVLAYSDPFAPAVPPDEGDDAR